MLIPISQSCLLICAVIELHKVFDKSNEITFFFFKQKYSLCHITISYPRFMWHPPPQTSLYTLNLTCLVYSNNSNHRLQYFHYYTVPINAIFVWMPQCCSCKTIFVCCFPLVSHRSSSFFFLLLLLDSCGPSTVMDAFCTSVEICDNTTQTSLLSCSLPSQIETSVMVMETNIHLIKRLKPSAFGGVL